MRNHITVLFFFFFCVSLQAQRAYIVKDLNPGTPDAFDLTKTGLLAELKDEAIFIAYAKGGIRLLCTTDGTQPGTVSLLPPIETDDIFQDFTVSGGLFWFILNKDGVSQLYSTDRTWGGTLVRHEVQNNSVYFSKLRPYKGGVVFHAKTAPFDDFLMRYDSVNGLQDLGEFDYFGGIMDMCIVGDEIWGIGSATASSSDRYVFRSNGEPNGVNPFFLLNSGNEFNKNTDMTTVDNKAYFFFEQNDSTASLWVTDGTETGTKAVLPMERPLVFGGPHIFPARDHIAFDGAFYFQGKCAGCTDGMELWKSDGTVAGTVQLGNFDTSSGDSKPQLLTEWDNKLCFIAKNWGYNSMLWQTDGTIAGTNRLLTQFGGGQYHGLGLAVYKDSLAFGGLHPNDFSAEAFLTDGTAVGTHSITEESLPDDEFFAASNFLQAGEKLFFAAKKTNTGRELWCYDPNLPPLVDLGQLLSPKEIKSYPNPCTNTLFLDLEKLYNDLIVSILTVDGSVVQTQNFPGYHNQFRLDVSLFESGVYQIVLMENGLLIAVDRFIKK